MIAALDGGPSALAAQAATSTIPILFLLGADPAKFGFVAADNMTGLTAVPSELMGKRVGLLCEMSPSAMTVGYIVKRDCYPTFRLGFCGGVMRPDERSF
jgi:putative tryptophan/tyrosine transport system substrate-binding protein